MSFVFGGGADLGAGRMDKFVGQAMGKPVQGLLQQEGRFLVRQALFAVLHRGICSAC